MKRLACFLIAMSALSQSPSNTAVENGAQRTGNLLTVKRIYVSQLTGGPGADALRELIISGINSTKLFILTDNPDRADAVLKGAADDHTFVDSFDSTDSVGSREDGGKYGSGSSSSSKSGGYGGLSGSQNESHHIKERKHEAYASVRLCAANGDVLWSTTQESLGAKFRGASADVAAKVAHQLLLDVGRLQHTPASTLPVR